MARRRTINANILHGKEPSPQNVTEKPPKQRGGRKRDTESPPVPGRKKRGRAAQTTDAGQPRKGGKKPGAKWQQYSELPDNAPKPKSISTWRQLTMHLGEPAKQTPESRMHASHETSSDAESDYASPNQQPQKQKGQGSKDSRMRTHPRCLEHAPSVQEHSALHSGSSEKEEVDICSSPAGLPAASLLPSCPQSPSQQDAQPPADDPPEPWFPLQSSPRASQPASVSGIATPPGHPQMGRYWQ